MAITLRRVLMVLGGGTVAFYLAHFLTFSLPERFSGIGWVLLFSTVPWAILAAVQWDRLTRPGRRATILLGALMFVIVLVLHLIESQDQTMQDTVIGIVIAAVGGVPFLGGLAWLLRR